MSGVSVETIHAGSCLNGKCQCTKFVDKRANFACQECGHLIFSHPRGNTQAVREPAPTPFALEPKAPEPEPEPEVPPRTHNVVTGEGHVRTSEALEEKIAAAAAEDEPAAEELAAGKQHYQERNSPDEALYCCIVSGATSASRVASSRKGVTAKFLIHFLKTHVSTGMETWQLKQQFTLEATATHKCALVEVLKPEYVGTADVFVSHAYSYLLEDSIECMLRYEETHPGSVYWFDPFSLNQHPVPGGTVPTKDLIAAFGDRILEFQATLIVAAPWNNPAFLDRAWCCFLLLLVSVCISTRFCV